MQQQTVKCPNCGADAAGPVFCTTCGSRLPPIVQQVSPETQPIPPAKPATREPAVQVKYGALRAVSTVYRIIGWVIMVGGSLFAIALGVLAAGVTGTMTDFLPISGGPGTVAIAIIGLIASILIGLFMVAFADVCNVLMDIEKNTRE